MVHDHIRPSAISPGSIAVAIAVAAALAYSTQSGDVVRDLFTHPSFRGIPYFHSASAAFSDAIVMIAFASLAARRSPLSIVELAGINAPVLRPLLLGAVIFAPALVICLLTSPLAAGLTPRDFFWKAIGFPAIEEFVYRGLAIGVLMRLAGWPFWAAALLPAAFFGAVHTWQGEDPASIAGIVAITGFGGLVFGWLFVRWGYNLWPAILLHAGLNGLWMLFDLGENAIGGWLGNAMRFGVVALAIGGTLLMTRRSAATREAV